MHPQLTRFSVKNDWTKTSTDTAASISVSYLIEPLHPTAYSLRVRFGNLSAHFHLSQK